MSASPSRTLSRALSALLIASGLGLAGCDRATPGTDKGKASAKPAAAVSAASVPAPAVVAEVDGVEITETDIAPLLAVGMDRANAIDRAINRAIAAKLAADHYQVRVADAKRAAELEIAANVYVNNKMEELLKKVTDAEIQERYNKSVRDADFNGYQLAYGLFPTEDAAKEARELAISGNKEALKHFEPLATDKEGKANFLSRNEVPYNLGLFVAKLSPGGYTEPAVVRNGFIVLRLVSVKENPKPELAKLKDILRRAIADERLVKDLADARKAAQIKIK